ncbi:MAG: Valine-tRNA ligase [Candidatus Moranbacteria bacterium GW2011_GWE2_35_2-]|nr:MAG: Valine-tRNA ligase [Candidatus Moranbacteria bacterium GW2011_GWE2_35_2-]KKQ04785.1 MAG: Valine-tRNA ligase [Candidatus Moranbacteria bacterium GW2011_GWF1_36_4]KKQ22550.1 MAG: Valine-tRNA ligase [Candidatus Moranbacteria bacterium GW2011_GWF2_37_11]KKQ29619.1 MAG: Valine-tRNA ligase [Candidatus Moranbacteria bacterium GW2011_GWD1_37_17]KKQ30511.1 MAG: Valine-tRNA ligase [Candidatus Moranbacteria bacterium GW2011_GWE1_37_24]KKQ46675.1 MAG: Valine-tRNA ligase [Candidatus Moranbacteria b
MEKQYDPQENEDRIYQKWEDSGFFNPDNLEGEPYSIMMPPPNVTGVLHLGHAMENTLMDIMARYQRMQGKKVLLLPGTDHAAVATQAKVEKILIERGIKDPRKELGREKLLEEIRSFAENSKSTILQQIRKMGTSCDWSRLAYTFDETRSKIVNEVFQKMYTDGLIYRGHRVVNWSVKGQSTCSDDELEYKERIGKIYTFKYCQNFPIAIATTRPETKLGDTAVAVNPKDERYVKYIGQTFEVHDFAGSGIDLKIKIIAEDSVDMNFGTGAVGVTPAHSMVDFEMREKQISAGNEIKLIQVIDQNGKMNEKAGQYQNFVVKEAREKIVAWIKSAGLLEKEEEITQNVSTSDRFGDIVEVLPMTQWFVAVNKKIPGKNKTLKELMKEAVETGLNNESTQKITITPSRFEKIYFNWIDNLRDWCISRQVWWGHRLPVWYCQNPDCQKPFVSGSDMEKCPLCGGTVKQDPDTLDTWFSSGLWTFSTLTEKERGIFHPTSWMQMGSELLFFWMARMILMSTYCLNEIPFKNVYIHGMLRNEKGDKFSKSAGNNIDPIDISKKYGTDALRLSLISGISPGSDSKFYQEKIESARNFINKLWNISRYIINKNQESKIINQELNKNKLTLADFWILQKMSNLIEEIINEIETYNFSLAIEKIREFVWNDFADWYVEVSKFENNKTEKNIILNMLLEDILKIIHPYAPFVTENIWSILGKETLLISEKYPEKESYWKLASATQTDEMRFDLIKEIIIAIRNLRSENKIEPGKKIKVVFDTKNSVEFGLIKNKDLLNSQENLIKNLRTGVEKIEIIETGEKPSDCAHTVVAGVNIFIPLEGLIDIQKEKTAAEKEIENLKKYISDMESRLNNKSFVQKAPAQIVAQEQKKLKEAQIKISELEKYLEKLK